MEFSGRGGGGSEAVGKAWSGSREDEATEGASIVSGQREAADEHRICSDHVSGFLSMLVYAKPVPEQHVYERHVV